MGCLRKEAAPKSTSRPAKRPMSAARPAIFEGLEDRALFSATFPPADPSALAAKAASSTAIKLNWHDNSVRETGYKIERSTDGSHFSQINVVSANTQSYTSGGLNNGKKYYFRVRAYNSGGNSHYTNVASAVTGSTTSSTSSTTTTTNTKTTKTSSGVLSSNFAGVSVNIGGLQPSNTAKYIAVLKTLHVKAVRLWFGMDSWNNRGGNWGMQEAHLFHSAGFKVLMNVGVADVPSYSQAAGFFNYIRNRPGALNDVDIWEIGNEPDRPPFWHGTPSQYVNNVLKAAWDVLHPAGAKILGAGPSWDPNFAQTLVDAGYLKYCDYAGMHPYGGSVAQVLDRATRAVAAYRGKPVIFSEWNVRGATSTSQWSSELNQIAPALSKIGAMAFYFGLQKCNSMAGPSGLINSDGSPNGPYYSMYKSWFE